MRAEKRRRYPELRKRFAQPVTASRILPACQVLVRRNDS